MQTDGRLNTASSSGRQEHLREVCVSVAKNKGYSQTPHVVPLLLFFFFRNGLRVYIYFDFHNRL